MSQFRKLKIHSKHRPRRRDCTTIPQIRLEGQWLAKLGFREGDRIQIKQQRNKLTITLYKEK